MPMVWSQRQVLSGTVEQIIRCLEGKHLPSCNNHDLDLSDCTCGGPEREILLQAYAESIVGKTLVSSAGSVG
jgi:hypothetical protein